jgi:hypothetical protein
VDNRLLADMETLSSDLAPVLQDASNQCDCANDNHKNGSHPTDSGTMTTTTTPPSLPKDGNIPSDAYKNDPRRRQQKQKKKKKQSGRNTESFDPSSTWVRPSMRIRIGDPRLDHFPPSSSLSTTLLKHDDVVIVPEFFGPTEDWSLYYTLVREITELQRRHVPGSEWISWHEGSHLIVKKPELLPTFPTMIQKLCQYFRVRNHSSIGTRLNWYKDSSNWKPFHHDSA